MTYPKYNALLHSYACPADCAGFGLHQMIPYLSYKNFFGCRLKSFPLGSRVFYRKKYGNSGSILNTQQATKGKRQIEYNP